MSERGRARPGTTAKKNSFWPPLYLPTSGSSPSWLMYCDDLLRPQPLAVARLAGACRAASGRTCTSEATKKSTPAQGCSQRHTESPPKRAAIQPKTGVQMGRPDRRDRKKKKATVQWIDPRGEAVADDLVAHHDVLRGRAALAAAPTRGTRGHRAHGRRRLRSSASSDLLGPSVMKCAKAPITAPKMANSPRGRSTDFQTRTRERDVRVSRASPYHSGWSPWASTVTTPVPPTPGGS